MIFDFLIGIVLRLRYNFLDQLHVALMWVGDYFCIKGNHF